MDEDEFEILWGRESRNPNGYRPINIKWDADAKRPIYEEFLNFAKDAYMNAPIVEERMTLSQLVDLIYNWWVMQKPAHMYFPAIVFRQGAKEYALKLKRNGWTPPVKVRHEVKIVVKPDPAPTLSKRISEMPSGPWVAEGIRNIDYSAPSFVCYTFVVYH